MLQVCMSLLHMSTSLIVYTNGIYDQVALHMETQTPIVAQKTTSVVLSDIADASDTTFLHVQKSVVAHEDNGIIVLPIEPQKKATTTKNQEQRVVDLTQSDPYYTEDVDAERRKLSAGEKKDGEERFVALMDDLGIPMVE